MKQKGRKKKCLCSVVLLAIAFSLFAGVMCRRIYQEVKDSKNNIADMLKDFDSETKNVYTETSSYKVYPSGQPIGIYVKTKGVMVIGTTTFANRRGEELSPCHGLIKQGDYIVEVNGEAVKNKSGFVETVSKAQGKILTLSIMRGDRKIRVKVKPAQDKNGLYKLGLWVKDDLSGIGTMTFVDEHGFAALGHSINDNQTGQIFNISEGAIYNARIVNIIKPEKNVPGRLEGMIDYASSNMLGKIDANACYGISGCFTGYDVEENCNKEDWILLGDSDEVHKGKAYILSALSGERVRYEVEITDINRTADNHEKNMEIKVTDEKLKELTGGIIQGMSGSPIIQDNKLVGAVTHVFVNDPTKGYGIFIENMLQDNSMLP